MIDAVDADAIVQLEMMLRTPLPHDDVVIEALVFKEDLAGIGHHPSRSGSIGWDGSTGQ